MPGVITTTSLTACGTSISQFVNYTIGSTNYSLIAPADSITGYRMNTSTWISASTQSFDKSVYFSFTGTNTVGTHPLGFLNISQNNKNYMQQGTVNVAVTEYGNVNEYIAGNISGTLTDSTTTYPFTISFRVKRLQ